VTTIIGSTRIWTYTAQGIIPPQVPPEAMEAWVRAAISWNDTILAWMRGTNVVESSVDPAELQRLLGGAKGQ
jgi:hypothetical protein